jgi:CRISPR/Cas system CMR-associated protein Cmr5 small subunit
VVTSLTLNGTDVEDELDKITSIEEKTTDQSYVTGTNTTSFANNVNVVTSLTLNGTDVEDELDKITSIEEKTTEQTRRSMM